MITSCKKRGGTGTALETSQAGHAKLAYKRALGRQVIERKLSGGCACRAVRYEAGVAPVMMLNCHCRDCQQAGGSAYAAIVVVSRSSLDVQGELRFRETVGDNGKPVRRGFCPACGSQVLMELGRLPEILALHAGSLDDPSIHQPKLDLFTASAPPWDAMLPDTRKVAAGLG